MSQKRTIDSFFSPPAKKTRVSPAKEPAPPVSDDHTPKEEPNDALESHKTYPFPIKQPSISLLEELVWIPATEPRAVNDKPNLDLLYFEPFVPRQVGRELFEYLRRELFFYRVKYKIKRGAIETQINTPRYTTVFGVDATSRFSPTDDRSVVDSKTGQEAYYASPLNKDYPRPIPGCLDTLRQLTEAATGHTFNFCLVNYYASGDDSISYHSDDERFLGLDPAIASLSLGAKRDFCMKPKTDTSSPALKFPLASGDMVLMKGKTQANWLHSIPKRKGPEAQTGRINITFRKALVKGGTENYYRYNVGEGEVFKWDQESKSMLPWKSG